MSKDKDVFGPNSELVRGRLSSLCGFVVRGKDFKRIRINKEGVK